MIRLRIILVAFLVVLFPTNLLSQKTSSNSAVSIESLLALLKTNQDDSTRVSTLNNLASKHIDKGNFEQGFLFAEKAQQYAKKNNFKKGIAKSFRVIGAVFYYRGDYKKALENYLQSLKICEEINDQVGIAESYNTVGLFYQSQFDFEKALENYLKSLKTSEKFAYKEGIAIAYNNLGSLYSGNGEYKKALEYQLKSLKINEEFGDKLIIANSYNSLGNICNFQGNYKQAINYYLIALKNNEEVGNQYGVAVTYYFIGSVYYMQIYYKAGEDLNRGNFDEKLVTSNEKGFLNSASIIEQDSFKLRAYQKSIIFLNQSIFLARKTDAKTVVKNAYQMLSDVYNEVHDYKQAYAYHKLFFAVNDSIFNEKKNKQMAELNTKYETEKKEKEILLLNKDKDKKAAEAIADRKTQQVIWISAIVFLVLITFLSVFAFRNYRQKQTAKMEAIEKEKIKAELGLLINQISPHVMFNTLNTIYFQMDEDASTAKEMIMQFSDLLRYQLYECNVEYTEIEKEINYLNKFIEIQRLKKSNRCKIDFSVSDDVKGFLIAPLLLIPLIENAFKYVTNDRDSDNYVSISLTKNKNKMILITENTTYTSDEKAKSAFKGIGLSNLKSRLHLIYPKRHKLNINKEGVIFKVKLVINV